jgi:hypothetical protein
MADTTEIKTHVTIEEVSERQIRREEEVDRHFAEIDAKLANQPTREEFLKAVGGLANKEDVARLNNYVQTFTIGVQVLEKSGRWVLYAVIAIGGLAAGFLVLKNVFVFFIGLLGFTRQ